MASRDSLRDLHKYLLFLHTYYRLLHRCRIRIEGCNRFRLLAIIYSIAPLYEIPLDAESHFCLLRNQPSSLDFSIFLPHFRPEMTFASQP